MVVMLPEQQNNELYSFQWVDFSGKMKEFSTQKDDPNFVPELKNNLKKDEENKFLKVWTEQTKTSEAQKVFKKRIAEIDKELENMVITLEYRNELELEKKNLEQQLNPWMLDFSQIPKYDEKYQGESKEIPWSKNWWNNWWIKWSVANQMQELKLGGKKVKWESWSINQRAKIEHKNISQTESFRKIKNLIVELPTDIELPYIVEKFKNVTNLNELSKDDIKALQREFWMWNIDGILGKDTYNWAYNYFTKLAAEYYRKTKKIKQEEQQKKEVQEKTQKGKNTQSTISQQNNSQSFLGNLWPLEGDISEESRKISKNSTDIEREENEEQKKNTSRQNIHPANIAVLKKNTLRSYNILEQTKLNIPYAKTLIGESMGMKNIQSGMQTMVLEKQHLEKTINTTKTRLFTLEADLKNLSQDTPHLATIKQNLEKNIITLDKSLKEQQLRFDQLEKNIVTHTLTFKSRQLQYLRNISSEKEALEKQIKQWHSPQSLEKYNALQEKLDFLTAIERSQRMLVGLDDSPNRYGFYRSPEWIILRQSEAKSGSPDVQSDLQQGFYDTDDFGRLIYLNNTSDKMKPEIFHGFKRWKKPSEYNWSTQQVIENGKEENLGFYDRTIEQWSQAPRNQESSKDQILEAQDNLKVTAS